MKKIHILILQAFIKPFLVTFSIVMFVLLMLFLFKYIDDFIGKGLEWYTILELMGYQCVIQLSMALPLTMLLSSIMTFGNLGESYELVAIKAAGVSLRSAMIPLFILVGLFASAAFIFSDYALPVVNLKFGTMLLDVRNKKADFLIKPGVFNNTIPGYSIRAKSKSVDGTILKDLMIYNHNNNNKANSVLLAKEGYMHNSADNKFMIMVLKDGVQYEDSRVKGALRYNERQQFTRFRFDEFTQKFDMASFEGQKTDQSLFKSHHQMLNLEQLKHYSDSNQIEMDRLGNRYVNDIKANLNFFSKQEYNERYLPESQPVESKSFVAPVYADYFDGKLEDFKNRDLLITAMNKVVFIRDYSKNFYLEYRMYRDKDIRYKIEWHRKFTLAVSCLLLFGIGAPLGAIIRKGGLGLPVVMAIVFFLIYYVIFTISEKAAKDMSLTPFFGMWMAIIVLTPLAVFLTYKSTTDSALFDVNIYKNRINSAFDWIQKKLNIKSKSL